jgi:hypothetical protein
MSDKVITEKVVSLRIVLDSNVLDAFEARAVLEGVDVDHVIARHLSATKFFDAKDPIYLNDAQRAKLSNILGANAASTPAKLVDMIERLVTLRVGGLKIKLTKNQSEQIAERAKMLGRPVEQVAQQTIEDALAAFLGTR